MSKVAITPFTMNRDVTIASKSGHAIAFVAGEPTHVPKAMHHEVLAAGGVPADPDAIEHADQNQRPSGETPSDPEERKELILLALNDIKTRNVREDFTSAGQPKSKTVEKVLGFVVPSVEIAELWGTLLAKD